PKPLKRWPKVKFPDFTPAYSKRTVRAFSPSPSKARIQRMGRTNRGPAFASQYMLFGKLRLAIAFIKSSGRSLAAGSPFNVRLSARYSPLGVDIRVRS